MNRSVHRAAELLRTLSENRQAMTLTEIVNEVQLPDSTVFRLLRTLEQEGMVERADDGSGRYQLGLEMFRIGSKVLYRLGLGPQILPALEKLASETDETVNLGVLHSFNVLYLQKVESNQPLRAGLTVGSSSVPAYCSSTGKMLLSSLSAEELNSLLENHPLKKVGPNTIVERDALLQELDCVRKRGYAIDDLEFAADIRSVAALIHDYRGAAIAALAVAGPATRFSLDRAESLAPLVVKTADYISAQLGYVKSSHLARDMA